MKWLNFECKTKKKKLNDISEFEISDMNLIRFFFENLLKRCNQQLARKCQFIVYQTQIQVEIPNTIDKIQLNTDTKKNEKKNYEIQSIFAIKSLLNEKLKWSHFNTIWI